MPTAQLAPQPLHAIRDPLDPAPEALALADLTPRERELLRELAGNCAFRVRNGWRRRGAARTIRLDTASRLMQRGLLQQRPIRGVPAIILTQAAHAALALAARAIRTSPPLRIIGDIAKFIVLLAILVPASFALMAM